MFQHLQEVAPEVRAGHALHLEVDHLFFVRLTAFLAGHICASVRI